MDKSLLELFIKEIKNFNYPTIIFILFISTAYFVFDFFVIRHYMIHTICNFTSMLICADRLIFWGSPLCVGFFRSEF